MDIIRVSTNLDDVKYVADEMTAVQDAVASLDAVNTSMIQMATAFTNAQTRFVDAHAFQ
jgi:hypothetical protein